MQRHGRIAAVLFVAVVLGCGALEAQERQQEGQPGASGRIVDIGLVEEQVVSLARIRILVTDRNGRAIADLTPDEIQIFERGVPQQLAFLDAAFGAREEPASSLAVFRDPRDRPQRGDSIDVLPARAVRRVVLAFDVRNSTRSVRERWRQAASSWLSDDMQPEDRVGIVLLDGYPEWRVPLGGERETLQATLADLPLKKTAPSRDRGRDMSTLMTAIRACVSGDVDRAPRGGAAVCAYDTARPYVHQWNAESADTVQALRGLVGQLAAVPGRKAVLLFSDGIVGDASMMAVNAMVAVLGSQDNNLDLHKMKTRFAKDVLDDLAELQDAARAGDVAVFALDTTQGGRRGVSGSLEHSGMLPAVAMGIDPWNEMGEATSHTLDQLARESGGRAFRGAQALDEHLRAAAGAYFGMYTVGYYRGAPGSEVGEARVEIDREGVVVSYSDRAHTRLHRADTTPLTVVVGKPRQEDGSSDLLLPVAARVAFDALPLRTSGGSVGTVLGLHFQATRPDGTVVAEKFDVEVVAVERERLDEAGGKDLLHWCELPLPAGSYRIRARLSDDRQELAADRAVDLTLTSDDVRPGLATTPDLQPIR